MSLIYLLHVADQTSAADIEKLDKELQQATDMEKSVFSRKAFRRLVSEIEHHEIRANDPFFHSKRPLQREQAGIDALAQAFQTFGTNVMFAAKKQARIGGRIQIEPLDIRSALDIVHTWTGGEGADDEEMLEFSPKPRAEKRREVGVYGGAGQAFRGFNTWREVKDAQRKRVHPKLDHSLLPEGCLLCQDGVSSNPQTRWRRGMARPPLYVDNGETSGEEQEADRAGGGGAVNGSESVSSAESEDE